MSPSICIVHRHFGMPSEPLHRKLHFPESPGVGFCISSGCTCAGQKARGAVEPCLWFFHFVWSDKSAEELGCSVAPFQHSGSSFIVSRGWVKGICCFAHVYLSGVAWSGLVVGVDHSQGGVFLEPTGPVSAFWVPIVLIVPWPVAALVGQIHGVALKVTSGGLVQSGFFQRLCKHSILLT